MTEGEGVDVDHITRMVIGLLMTKRRCVKNGPKLDDAIVEHPYRPGLSKIYLILG